MTKYLFTAIAFLIASFSYAQVPGVQWSKRILVAGDTSKGQIFYAVAPLKTGGFVFAGSSNTGLLSPGAIMDKELGGARKISKTDASGNVIWSGSTTLINQGCYNSVIVSKENEYVAAGFIDRPLYFGNGSPEFTFSRFSSNGTLLTDTYYGGNYNDFAQGIAQGLDGHFVLAGYTGSSDTMVTGNHGGIDFWLVKVDTAGTARWKKCFGGSGDDKAYSIKATPDSGYIVAGSSYGVIGGNITVNSGGINGWVIKVDKNGNLVWQKSIGGSNTDVFRSVILTPDGGYLLTGYTSSTDKDVSGNHGGADLWVVKIDKSGNIMWQKCLGGTAEDWGFDADVTPDNAYQITGRTLSTNGDVSEVNGGSDIFVAKISSTGSVVWRKAIGTVGNEFGFGVKAVSENEFYLLGVVSDYTGGTVMSGNPVPRSWLHKLGNSSSIKGTVFVDRNLNGIKDSNEQFFSDVMVKTEKPVYQRAAIPYQGSFKIDVDTGTYKSSVSTANHPYYTIVPASITSFLPSYFTTDTIVFALQPIRNKRDLAIDIFPLTPARPGFISSYKILYHNQGTDTISNGTIQMIKPGDLQMISSIPAFTSVKGDTVTWSYANLKPFDTSGIIIKCRVDSTISISTSGQLTFKASIMPVLNDLQPLNNNAILRQYVTGSFDPNDKSETHGGTMKQTEVTNGEYLTYTIRFQNTGTDTAFNISVRDTLDSKLDWNSLEMVSASHKYQLNVNDANKCLWMFSNVLLVDSNHNEPLSHGYIVYRVKPKATFAIGDTIKNKASIYFDYNLPVETNVEKTVVESVVLPVKILNFSAGKEGAKNKLKWSSSYEINTASYEIEKSTDGLTFNAIAKVATLGSNYTHRFFDEKPLKLTNFYRLKMIDKDGSFEYSSVRQINNGVIVDVAVYPNPASNVILVAVHAENGSASRVNILDLNGKTIKPIDFYSSGSFNKTVDISHLAKGFYFVQVNSTGGVFTVRFEKL